MSVLLQRGGGSFGAPATFPATSGADSLALGDLDGDGDLDVVTTNSDRGCDDCHVSVFINEGGGVLAAEQKYGAGVSDASDLALGDLDGDGDLDAAATEVGIDGRNRIVFLFNDARGEFGAPALLDTTAWTSAIGGIALGDLDGDGDVDAAVTDRELESGSNVSIFLNQGGAAFAFSAHCAVESAPDAVALGDMDGDGDPDIVTESVSVLLNRGGGGFPSQGAIFATAGAAPRALVLGDLDGDGRLDVAAADPEAGLVSLLFNLGAGRLAARASFLVSRECCSPPALALADLDGDSDLDVAAAVGAVDVGLSVLVNRGDGVLAPPFHLPTGGGFHASEFVAAGDLDGDGNVDLISADPHVVAAGSSDPQALALFLNLGGASFAPASFLAVPGGVVHLALADLDRDGDLDIATASSARDSVSIVRNRGDATFLPAVSFAVGDMPQAVGTGDIDGDHVIDLVTANGAGTVSVLRNLGLGSFAPAVAFPAGADLAALAVGDFDRDADVDVAAASRSSSEVAVLFNESGTLGAPVCHPVGGESRALVAADLDRDGDLDLFTGVSRREGPFRNDFIAVLLNEGNGEFATAEEVYVSGLAASLAAGDLDRDTDIDIIAAIPDGGRVEVLFNATRPPSMDCNANGIPDEVDIASGASADENGDGVPDECEPAPHRIVLQSVRDSFIRLAGDVETPENTNEGRNALLRVQTAGTARALVAFDLHNVLFDDLGSATLVLAIAGEATAD